MGIISAPGDTNRLFIMERAGRVAVITNLAAPNRTIYLDISSGGNLRFSYSADLGGGFVRFPVKPVAVVSQNASDQIEVDWNRTIAKTDTRPVGTFLYGTTLGMLWNLSSHFAISLDVRVLSGLPHWGAVVEGGLSVQLAFGGQKGPAAASDDSILAVGNAILTIPSFFADNTSSDSITIQECI